jgi:hypothetical protein
MPSTSKPASKPAPPIITRGISINEPWAWAIVAGPDPAAGRGWKPIENRTWPTAYRGPVAIHASTAKRHLTEETIAFIYGADSRIIPRIDSPNIDKDNQIFHLGAIIGTADIVGCIEFKPTGNNERDWRNFERAARAAGLDWWLNKYQGDWEAAGRGPEFFEDGEGKTWSTDAFYWADGPYCFLLDNARQFTQPIAARGRLNIYNLAPEEIAAVGRALRAPLGCPVEYRAKLKTAKQGAAAAIAKSRPPAVA